MTEPVERRLASRIDNDRERLRVQYPTYPGSLPINESLKIMSM